MAVQSIDLPRDTTMKDIAASLRAIAGFTAADLVTMKQVKAIVEGKKEKEVFTVGDQITVPWTDKATNVTYAAVMDVVHFGDVELKDGETTNAMFLQWHYCTPFGVQYDAPEAEVATEATFSAEYNYYTKNSDGSFSLAAVTIGGAIPAGTTYYHSAIKDTSGNICRYGYNRWSHSAMRQWLNSKIFLPEYQTALTNDIIHTAKEIFTKAWTANNIRVGDEPRNWLARKKLQQEAARECNNLLALIQMAKPLYHLTSKRVKYWGQKTIEVRQALRDWNAGDTKRYGKLE